YFFQVTNGNVGSAGDTDHLQGLAISFCTNCLVHQFWDQTVDGVTLGAVYALVALGYTLVYGVLRLINFAHSEVFMVGAFGALFATRWMGIELGDPTNHGPLAVIGFLIVCGVVAMAFSGGTAVALELIAYRPLRRR